MSQRLRWFFYSGHVAIPVKLADGRIYSVRPRGHVYTTDALAAKANNLSVCAPPKNAAEILASLAIKPQQAEAKPSSGNFAAVVQELGKSTADAPVPEPPREVAKKPPARVPRGRVIVPEEPT
jgi:hypothetical protein